MLLGREIFLAVVIFELGFTGHACVGAELAMGPHRKTKETETGDRWI